MTASRTPEAPTSAVPGEVGHIPGPWLIRNDGLYLRVVHGEHKTTVAGEIVSEANARLIASAPELLEALEVFRAFGCPRCSGDCAGANPPVMTCPMQVAQFAIAKARGEA